MAQWVKNPTSAAWVTAKTQVLSPALYSRLKDPVLLQLWCGLGYSCSLELIPGPRTSICHVSGHKKIIYLQRYQSLIPGIFEYVIIHSKKRNFAEVIKDGLEKGEYCRVSKWVQYNQKVLKGEKQRQKLG